MKKVFIDGSAGTTGLRIVERLSARSDIELIKLPEDLRKNNDARRTAINSADVVFLCLPDAAARESVAMVENPDTVILDTSTAHRTDPAWLYGFPEVYPNFSEKLSTARRIAVPGCHASGFIALVKPLIDAGIIPKSARLTCHSITGYSGGGKKMISEYEGEEKPTEYNAPRQYGLTQNHKHLPEMKTITGLEQEPIFCPIVSDFYSGMTVTVPVFASELNKGMNAEHIRDIYKSLYTGPVVTYEYAPEGMISALELSRKDSMKITVAGNDDRILLIARYDNLGKGASGAAIELFNMITKADLTTGLEI